MVLIKRFIGCLCFLAVAYNVTAQKSIWSEPVIKEGLEHIRRLEESAKDSLQYARELFSLAQYCQHRNMYKQGEELSQLAIQILEAKLATTQQETENIQLYKDLINIYTFVGNNKLRHKGNLIPGGMIELVSVVNYTQSIVIRVLELTQKEIETGNNSLLKEAEDLYASISDNWDRASLYCWEAGNFKEAIYYLTQALKSKRSEKERTLIENRLKALTLLADSSSTGDQYLKIAEQMYHPISLAEIFYNQRLPDYFKMFKNAARKYEMEGNLQKTSDVYHRILELLTSNIEKDLPYLLPAERSNLWDILKPYYEEMEFFMCDNMICGTWEEIAELLYESQLLKKELFTTVSYKLQETISTVQDSYVFQLQQQIEKLRFSEKAFRNPSQKNYIQKLENEITVRNMEFVLTDYLKKKYPVKYSWHHEWKEIAASLSPKEAVVDIVSLPISYNYFDRIYIAIAFTAKDTLPHLIPLTTKLSLHQLFVHNKLYSRFWQPIEKAISGCEHIYLSLDGDLSQIPFADLHNGQQYISEKYILHHLLYTGDIPFIKSQRDNLEHAHRDIFFFGGAKFNIQPENDDQEKLRGQGFAYLPGTVKEINSISQLLSNQWKIHKYIGEEANEASFKQLSNQSMSGAVLHVATHGFNLEYNDSIQSTAINHKGESGYKEPLMRTGFILTGANKNWVEELPLNGENDGILTALEISAMNLTGIELAVLSTCHSAQGEIHEGEGSFGLQRAFRLAGVRSMIISLSEIPDRETVEFMTGFYRYWQQGMSKPEAFTKTQREMIGKYRNDPQKWAYFILVE
ncbi:CHAT domain-containing protein [uncultured Bacteroides sp.]|uniref:CHAT domain-containing protein n=1 Tax=uncultured Bacteroides sp. TaxID=162156 RepID=UPI0027DB716B|nr:CHAT domain-containing protein [uncultured Bacteroides sp.]